MIETKNMPNGIVMLARNSELANKKLSNETILKIKKANNEGKEFIV